jgi:hypothetical protein
VQKPIWNTEINYGLTGKEVPPAPENEQVANVVTTYLLNAANGVERVYWYGWDQTSIVDTLLTEPDGTLTRAGKAFGTVHDWMLGATVTGCEQDAEKTWTCTLDHPDGQRTVYWNAESPLTMTLAAGTTGYQRVGHRLRDATPGEELTVGQVPVMVVTTA